MKKFIKLLSLVMAALMCVACFTACGNNKAKDDNGISMEDGEDEELRQGSVQLANTSGKDAVELLMRRSTSTNGEWASGNLLKQEYLHNNKAISIDYKLGADPVYDVRLVFEDGTYQDYLNLDFGNAKSIIYLGEVDESTTN